MDMVGGVVDGRRHSGRVGVVPARLAVLQQLHADVQTYRRRPTVGTVVDDAEHPSVVPSAYDTVVTIWVDGVPVV